MPLPSIRFTSKAAAADGGEILQCELCPHYCKIPPDKSGLCRVRFNSKGQRDLPHYGYVTAIASDPIEKKPLYHFRPGSQIFSVGFVGCNMHCPFCQNWHISQYTDASGRPIHAVSLITLARNCGQIAYTYSEPLVHIEFLLDCMKQARKAGMKNVLVTNGCINSGAADEVLDLTDAANIDLKCFSKETYSKILGGDLDTVLGFIKKAYSKRVHIEITTLVVPGLNDSITELEACADFIAGLGNSGKSSIPWHLSAYHPDWNWNAPATSPEFLTDFAAKASGYLAYVYTGNIHGGQNETVCHNCGKTIITRRGYNIDKTGLAIKNVNNESVYVCAFCNKAVPIIM